MLLDWFACQARDLPWRRTRDPYAVWVSEIMLQQTQVKTVIPYWHRWMATLPSIESVAQADPGKIHKLWDGLGYYTRVRNLQKAARVMVEKHGGKFPEDFEEVLDLPGIGRYTAGAICSIAFNQPKPVLDGNVIRVLTRVFGIGGNPADKAVNTRLWQLAERLVQVSSGAQGCSQLNQSLMELGALICTPRQPGCGVCPLSKSCLARKQGRVEELPELPARPQTTRRRFVAFVVRRGSKFLVQQRPAGVVNAHLWEFPNLEVGTADGQPAPAALEVLGARAHLTPVCTIHHSITRYRIQLDVYAVRRLSHEASSRTGAKWIAQNQLTRLAFASAHKKILPHLRGRSGDVLVPTT